MSRCKNCPEVEVVLVAHEFLCPACGMVSGMRPQPSLLANVPFKEKEAYKEEVFEEDTRLGAIKGMATRLISQIPLLEGMPPGLILQIEKHTFTIIDRCFPDETKPKRDFPMPREHDIVAAACVLIVVCNMRQFQGCIRAWQIIPDREMLRRVVQLRSRIEKSRTVKLYETGIIARASEVDKQKNMMNTICNSMQLPYKLTCLLVERFKTATDQVLMKGRSSYYLAGGVIIHCLSGKCAHFPHKLDLTDAQLDLLSANLNIKKKSLMDYTAKFAEKCCGGE